MCFALGVAVVALSRRATDPGLEGFQFRRNNQARIFVEPVAIKSSRSRLLI
jgi:hypothetical protein